MTVVESLMKAIVMKLENISSVDLDENFINLDILKKAYMQTKNVFQRPTAA